MRKHILALLVLVLTSITIQARPVDQETVKRLGQAFVKANFEFTRQSSDLVLVQTAFSDRGEACYYVYNVGETGFVILSADDNYRPIIGYSEEGIFNPDNIAPAMVEYMEGIRQSVMVAAEASSPSVAVAADWAMLEKTGRLVSRHGGREDEYLVKTKWNQNYPYNYFCPEGEGGPGGHCYAGCVATAASQLMKYWDHPIQGQGSYTYTPEDHPEYGPITVNFGETTYDWANMPNSINSSSPQEQIEAVAQLIFHVGVSVDMNYRPSSSGAVTGRLCDRMPLYFDYTNQMANLYRENYSHEEYMQLIINSIDMSWPMVHRGGGHAYVLDGYNDNDMVHFNWGWGGSGDNWFNVDDHDYTDGESVIYNYVPAAIYANTPNTPNNLNVIASADNSLSATVTWTNPSITLSNSALSYIDQIVVERDGQVVYTEDNVTPGADMTFIDESIPYYDGFDYVVYAVKDGQRGVSAQFKNVVVGPTCNWKVVMQSSSFQGWNGGYLSMYSVTGKEIQRMTITNSIPSSLDVAVPMGNFSFGWTAPNTPVSNMSITIKDSENNVVYTFSGASSELEQGILIGFNNGCGYEMPQSAPYQLSADVVDGNVRLNWDYEGVAPEYGFNVYRDDHLYGMVNDSTSYEFVDENITQGHCYTVAALGYGGETEHSDEICVSPDGCMAPSNFTFEYTGNNYRIKLLWDRPNPADGLTGYFLFRKYGEDGTYERVKLLGATATSYTDNTATVLGDYYYRLYAYYGESDCTSSPASVLYYPNLFYLRVYYSPTEVDESEAVEVKVYPNPANHSLSVEAEGMNHLRVCNMLGQVVMETEVDGNSQSISTSEWSEGLYVMTVRTEQGIVTCRISVVH